jgi:hypothetical protein
VTVAKPLVSFAPSGINNWQSEPHQQHQNLAERRYQTIKNWINCILDRTGAPANTWLLAPQHVCFLLNHMYNNNLNALPLTCLQGITVDISVLLRFHFWQPVYYKLSEPSFPSESKEALGHDVGISEHCGHALTYKVLSAESDVILYRFCVLRLLMMTMCVLACLEGRASPIVVLSRIGSIWISPNFLAPLMMRPQLNLHLLLFSILRTLLDAPSLWTNRKMVNDTEDELSNSLKIMSPW